MTIRFVALDTDHVRAIQRGGPDAYGNLAEKAVSDGQGVPCRHCLKPVEAGEDYLILAHRPFETEQPYAETGPIFLHAHECERAASGANVPAMYGPDRRFILRGYRDNHWINYEVAQVVNTGDIPAAAAAMLDRDDVAYLHMRSAEFNCYRCRIERA